MSQFLPGNVPKSASDSLQQIIARDPALPLQQDEQQLINRLLGNPGALPAAFWAAVIDRVVVDAPSQIPVSQLQGFSQFRATAAPDILTEQTTPSTSYTNLATTGPEITGLSDGQFLVLFGYTGFAPAGTGSVMSVSVNGAAASDNDWATQDNASNASTSRIVLKTLAGSGSNTITAKYRSKFAGTSTYSKRWLIALRTGN